MFYPQLPSPDEPRLDDWLDVLVGEWAQMGDGERVVVAHSPSCLLWLHAATRHLLDPVADRVLLVAPPGPAVTAGIAAIAGFLAPTEVYGRPLRLDTETLHGAGHLTIDDGYGPWTAALEWCRDGRTRLKE